MTLEISEMFNHENAIFYRFWIWVAELVKFVYLSCILQKCKKKKYEKLRISKILYLKFFILPEEFHYFVILCPGMSVFINILEKIWPV